MGRFLLGIVLLAAAAAAIANPAPDGFAPVAVATLSDASGLPGLLEPLGAECDADPADCARALGALFRVEQTDYTLFRRAKLDAAVLGDRGPLICDGYFGAWRCALGAPPPAG